MILLLACILFLHVIFDVSVPQTDFLPIDKDGLENNEHGRMRETKKKGVKDMHTRDWKWKSRVIVFISRAKIVKSNRSML